jgi:competence protein ComEC
MLGRRPGADTASSGRLFPVALAWAAVAGSLVGSPVPSVWLVAAAIGLLATLARPRHSWSAVGCVVSVAVLASGLSARAWDGAEPVAPGPFRGTVVLRTDPKSVGSGVRATGVAEGRHLEVWGFGRAGRRLAERSAGEQVGLAGTLAPLPADIAHRLAARHVVGRLHVDVVTGWTVGTPAAEAANRLRRLVERGARTLPTLGRGLYLGMVLGDDREQPDDQVDAFRRSGLAHLTAVSGQNVALALVIVGPLLRRLRPAPRLVATIAVISWFALLTRFEPSVLRATVMAGLAALTMFLGRPSDPFRMLCVAVAGLVLVDPLLVWSVGFWLSVGATAGIAVLARPLAARLPGPRPVAEAAGVSLGAQLGVIPASVAVFGGVPLASVPVNVVAAPLTGPVMIYGLPAGIAAALLPDKVAAVVQLPTLLLVRALDLLARAGAALPGGRGPWGAVISLAVALAILARRPRTTARDATRR